MYEALEPRLGNVIWRCNLHSLDAEKIFPKTFWADILWDWCVINYQVPIDKSMVLDQVLWYNSNLTMQNTPFFFKHWFVKGIINIWNLCTESQERFLTWDKAQHKWGKLNWLEYKSILKSIPDNWKQLIVNGVTTVKQKCLYESMLNMSKKGITRKIYNNCIHDPTHMYKYCDRWQDIGVNIEYNDYCRAFCNLYKITKITKFRDFQYRMLLKKIPCNAELFQWGVLKSPMCTFCKKEKETEAHLFYECQVSRNILKWLESKCTEYEIPFNIGNAEYVILNRCKLPAQHIISFLLLFIKQYIYRKRCQNQIPTCKELVQEIEYLRKLEYFNYQNEHKL